jgi:hypothetical protein
MFRVFWALALLAVVFGVDPIVLGTDRLGRSLSDAEKRRLGTLLREHDYPGARLVALRFAFKLTHKESAAQDLMGRVAVRLVRLGWDPKEVPLAKRLCRLVWSEWTNEIHETDTSRRAEEGFLREMEVTEGLVVPSVEQRAIDYETRREKAGRAQSQIDKLRGAFELAGDAVNLIWLDLTVAGETDVQKMAAQTGRDVSEFYAAAKRRKRTVRRLIAASRGLTYPEDD